MTANVLMNSGYLLLLRVSPRTLLTFCTSGVLLRTLMAGDEALSTVTHVIVVRLCSNVPLDGVLGAGFMISAPVGRGARARRTDGLLTH